MKVLLEFHKEKESYYLITSTITITTTYYIYPISTIRRIYITLSIHPSPSNHHHPPLPSSHHPLLHEEPLFLEACMRR